MDQAAFEVNRRTAAAGNAGSRTGLRNGCQLPGVPEPGRSAVHEVENCDK